MNAEKTSAGRSALRFIRELAIIVIIALVVSFVVKTWLVRSFYIPSASMEQTLQIDDRIMVNQLAADVTGVERGDIVVFDDPGGWLDQSMVEQYEANPFLEFIGLVPDDSGQQLIKRVIGTGGDTVECCDEKGRLIVNGEPITEDYLGDKVAPSMVEFAVTVPADSFWVMGDNRGNSLDSRFNAESAGGAFIPKANIVGTAFVINWPASRMQILHNPEEVFAGVPVRP